MSFTELEDEIIRLCREDGMEPDVEKVRKTLRKHSQREVERLLDACYRFGAKAIITYGVK